VSTRSPVLFWALRCLFRPEVPGETRGEFLRGGLEGPGSSLVEV